MADPVRPIPLSPAPNKGVAIVSDNTFLSDAVKRVVEQTLAAVPENHSTAVVSVDLQKGANLVVAHRFAKGGWNVDGAFYIGKSWEPGVHAGGMIKASW